MSRKDAAAILNQTGMPVVFYQWPDGSTPQFPCIRYADEGRRDFLADGINYFKRTYYSAILVSERKDDAAEQALEDAFDAAGVIYSKGETIYVSAEKLFQVEYTFVLPE